MVCQCIDCRLRFECLSCLCSCGSCEIEIKEEDCLIMGFLNKRGKRL